MWRKWKDAMAAVILIRDMCGGFLRNQQTKKLRVELCCKLNSRSGFKDISHSHQQGEEEESAKLLHEIALQQHCLSAKFQWRCEKLCLAVRNKELLPQNIFNSVLKLEYFIVDNTQLLN